MSNSAQNHQPALQETKVILLRELDIDPDVEQKDLTSSYDELKRTIAERIRHLLSSHYEHLLNLLYRIDVDETKVADTLASYQPDEVPDILAEMIIERQLQKVVTRQYYRQ